ncbi:hypothetical protein PROFUN_05943 [Planoprotostelium fungivorum]|uniref:Signal recognition particle 9 kDa protein n=1 Tax=Planoprotostelium fungivorum TaxID=1890364 RepID=A0A2P6N7P7_9EUKA|nr:hypothetical protein PROFUN_05943 [Planoprotostelium fungivorum]
MVYLTNWDEFFAASEKLYRERPDETRYSTKYRNIDGVLVIKVTDNRVALKYRTDQAKDLKKIDRMNDLFLSLMSQPKQ